MKSSLSSVLEATRYLDGGVPATGLVLPDRGAHPSEVDRQIRYQPVFDPAKIGASAVFEVDGAPCIYFASLAHPSPSEVARLHKLAWNHGLAPVLWIATPTDVLLYDCYSPPAVRESEVKQNELATFRQTAAGLRQLAELAGRFQVESGAFWRSSAGSKVSRKGRVDALLLRDLDATEEALAAEGLSARAAQKVVMRTIFFAYLVHRGVLPPDLLDSTFGCNDLPSAFEEGSRANGVFNWLADVFDGDLFGDTGNAVSLSDAQAAVLRDFLSATDRTTRQLSIFPYDFSVIPVELISSIYEKFAHRGTDGVAKRQSTHYTPLNIVALVLAESMEGFSGHETILDISCGSGVFLVEGLRRLVVLRVRSGEKLSRSLIRRTLREQIYGIDIDPSAITIAAFSLYLAALELDPAPRPPRALRFEPLIGHNLILGDAFDASAVAELPIGDGGADLVVGNPPWTRQKDNRSGIAHSEQRGYPLVRKAIDQAFLWRATEFVVEGGKLGLVLVARTFFSMSDQAREVRGAMLKRLSPLLIVDLAELRKEGLFPTATAPAAVLVARRQPSEAAGTFAFIHVGDPADFRQRGVLEVRADDVHQLPYDSLTADRNVLKVAAWGGPRDLAFVSRLDAQGRPLEDWVRQRGWRFGQGYQTAGSNRDTPRELRELSRLSPRKVSAFAIAPDAVDPSVPKRMHRPRDPGIYQGPLVIVSRGIGRWGFRSFFRKRALLYSESFTGIGAPSDDERLLRVINGVFNSSLAAYYFFLNSSGWGLERDEVKPMELLRFPFPERILSDDPAVANVVSAEEALFSAALKGELKPSHGLQGRRALDDAVFELFHVSSDERALIGDFLTFTLDRFQKGPRGKAYSPATKAMLDEYADTASGSLDSFFDVLGERRMTARVLVSKGPLLVVRFEVGSRAARKEFGGGMSAEPMADVWAAIEEIEAALQSRITPTLTARRSLRVYAEAVAYVIKSNEARHWTLSSALHDADMLLAESLAAETSFSQSRG